jgi:hypothetical protein
MFTKNPKLDKPKPKVIYETHQSPVSIFHPLTNIPIIVGNLEEKDEYKTEPFLPRKAQ